MITRWSGMSVLLALLISVPCLAAQHVFRTGEKKMRQETGTAASTEVRTPSVSGKQPNRLIHEKSPYLLQHAYNPVDWYAWGDAAFEKAAKENKPIFLSIGYSTCHWCHVMEHESFEDGETAQAMNEAFVSIKVDREERPDIDHIYMAVCQMITGAGGWPLNIIMTPDRKPFFAGTYFPKYSRAGRIGIIDLSNRVKELWSDSRDVVDQSVSKVMAALKQIPDDSPGEPLDTRVLDTAYDELLRRYDSRLGGFGQAPKFPTPHNMLFLLRYWKRTGRQKALEMVENTLQSMRNGGIWDQVGFGFHRYATDREWLLPHFEKMLYDQALIAMAYLETYQATGKREYADTAQEIFTYVLRDMRSPEGGFYSAEDADTEGVEGKFYVWTIEELRSVLGDADAQLMTKVFNVDTKGNFREEASGHNTGANILHLTVPIPQLAAKLRLSEEDLRRRIEQARQKLFAVRESRVHPHKDDKILTDWNGLMIAALSKGAQVLDKPEYAEAAGKASDFVLTTLRGPDDRLLHRFRDGEAAVPAHVDDYAFFTWGLLELYETGFDVRHLQAAIDLSGAFVARFWDAGAGGFFFTANDAERLILRKKEIYDGATPSGNSVAMLNFLRLGKIAGDPELEKKAHMIGRAFSGGVEQTPSAYTQLLMAVEFAVGPSNEVVLAGIPGGLDTSVLLKALRGPFLPNKAVVLRPTNEASPAITRIARYTEPQGTLNGKATAYVCRNYRCALPTTSPGTMLELLGAR